MRKVLILLFALFPVLTTVAQITFHKTYGGTQIDGPWCIKQTSDNGYMITGESDSYAPGNNDVFMTKLDEFGNLEWMKTYGGIGSDYGGYLERTADLGYIVTGRTASFGAGDFDFYLLKLDSMGNHIWSKTYGGPNYEEAYSLQQTSDLGYIQAGYTESFGAGNSDLYLVKTDTLGNLEWANTYGGPGLEGFPGLGDISIHEAPGGEFILAAYTNSFGAGLNDFYMLKIDNTGALIWSKTYGGFANDFGFGNSVGTTADGGYIMTGTTESFGAGLSDVYVVKSGFFGNLEWAFTYGGIGNDYGYDIQQTADGGYVIAGATQTFGLGGSDAYLIKINAFGALQWSRTFGGGLDDYAYKVEQTNDGGYVLTGYVSSFGIGQIDIYVIKTDANGNVGCSESSPNTIATNVTANTIETNPATQVSSNCQVNTPPTLFGSGGSQTTICAAVGVSEFAKENDGLILSPNPATASLTINSNIQYNVAKIYAVSGKLITSINSVNNTINIASLSKGIYFIQLINDETTITKKFVKQ